MADMGGARGLKLVDNPLSKLLPHLEAHVVDAAEQIWDKFAAEPTTRDAAARMVEHCEADPVKSAARLGRTAWNAYSINANYRTGNHLDAKNVPGSYSCLAVLEAGRPFCGSYYMVPHFREALDLRQGCVVFHRSGDKDMGYHGNSEIHCPAPSRTCRPQKWDLGRDRAQGKDTCAARAPRPPEQGRGCPKGRRTAGVRAP